jgi:hypothetical protein
MALNRGRGAQLAYILFLIGIPEVGGAPGPSGVPSTMVAARSVAFFGSNQACGG